MLVQDFLQDSAQRFPEKVALVCRGARLTYAQVEASANGLAQYLLRRGLRPGDRVVICLPNCPEAAIAVFGVLKVAGVFVFVNPSIKEGKLRYIVNNCRASALICKEEPPRIYEKTCPVFQESEP